MESIWKDVLSDDLSVCVRDTQTGRMVGAHIALDLATKVDPLFVVDAVGAINAEVENPVKQMCIRQGNPKPREV